MESEVEIPRGRFVVSGCLDLKRRNILAYIFFMQFEFLICLRG